jgi:hypothetical protein
MTMSEKRRLWSSALPPFRFGVGRAFSVALPLRIPVIVWFHPTSGAN